MAETIPPKVTTQTSNCAQVFRTLDNLQAGTICDILVMVSRKWDNATPTNQYLSTEFLLSDQAGNIMQCTALHKYNPLQALPLIEGNVYILKNILATENKDSYRVCKDNKHALLFLPETTIIAMEMDTKDFVRHPFEFLDFENIKPINDKYLIDVVGHVHNVWNTKLETDDCEFLDCQLINERGMVLDITLWGKFCQDFLTAMQHSPENTPIVFAAMSVDHLDGHLYLSTTLDTTIRSANEIQGCKQLDDALVGLKKSGH